MTASGTNYTRIVITVSGLSAYLVYVSGTDYSRIDLYEADGYPMTKTQVSGLYDLIDYAYGLMPSGVDAAPGGGVEW